MKLKYLVYGALALMCSSCDDLLEVTPENSVTFENFFKTEKDMETFLNGVRDQFRGACAFDAYRDPVSLGYVYDELSSSEWKRLNWDVSQFTPVYADLSWGPQYQVIMLANTILERIGQAQMTEDRKNYYKGEAHFYLAYTYFKIAQMWGEAPLQTNTLDITKKAKVSHLELLEYAHQQVNLALGLLPLAKEVRDAAGKPVTDKYHASLEVANALKTDLCLWMAARKNNDKTLLNEAIDAATFLIDKSGFSLALNPEEVCSQVINGGSNEGIFEIQFEPVETRVTHNPWTNMIRCYSYPVDPMAGRGDIQYADARIYSTTVEQMYPGGYPSGEIAPENFKGDRRRLSYFYQLDEIKNDPENAELSGGFAYPYKFRKIMTGTDSWNVGRFECFASDHVLYRLADIILLRAEAYVRNGQNGLAEADLNRIRERAYGDRSADYKSTEGDLRYCIFKEREKELLWEGKRYFDVVRNGYWKTELSEFHRTKMTQQDVDDGALFMPVGQGAFVENSLMTQNKYWKNRY